MKQGAIVIIGSNGRIFSIGYTRISNSSRSCKNTTIVLEVVIVIVLVLVVVVIKFIKVVIIILAIS